MKRLSSTDQNDNPLINVPEPIDPQDATNKEYVDEEIIALAVSL